MPRPPGCPRGHGARGLTIGVCDLGSYMLKILSEFPIVAPILQCHTATLAVYLVFPAECGEE